METLVPHLVATLIYLSQIYSYYIRGDRSPLNFYYSGGHILAALAQIFTIIRTTAMPVIAKNYAVQSQKAVLFTFFLFVLLLSSESFSNDNILKQVHVENLESIQ